MPVVVGIGEVLWDLLPQGKRPGGAPANFVFHCGQLGVEPYLVSAIGDDDLGREMKNVLTDLAFNLTFLTTSKNDATSTVSVTLDQDRNPYYQIRDHVAWDTLSWSPQLERLARTADAVCFGSLAQRSLLTRETIHRFLDGAGPHCLRVFDVNLRKPYPDSAVLRDSLKKATVVKLNEEELDYLSRLLGLEGDTRQRMAEMIRQFDLSCLALTRGAQGSILMTGAETVDCPGIEVPVQDTVGAGDAFTAALVVGWLRQWPLDEINVRAGHVAACVCSQAGAMVEFPAEVAGRYQTCGLPVREYRQAPRGREDRRQFETRS